jgi:hypothetical protein
MAEEPRQLGQMLCGGVFEKSKPKPICNALTRSDTKHFSPITEFIHSEDGQMRCVLTVWLKSAVLLARIKRRDWSWKQTFHSIVVVVLIISYETTQSARAQTVLLDSLQLLAPAFSRSIAGLTSPLHPTIGCRAERGRKSDAPHPTILFKPQ